MPRFPALLVGLLGLAPLINSPAMQAQSAAPALHASPAAERFLGVWALSDSANNLFNVRLSADGRALSTWGASTRPQLGTTPEQPQAPLRAAGLFEQGRWQSWGNGVRIDYADGWSDWLLVGPGGALKWSWAPGVDRSTPPTNHGQAVKLTAQAAMWVGVYRIEPSQAQLPAYDAVLLSDGSAFNGIDRQPAGRWSVQPRGLMIDWLSGWSTLLLQEPGRGLAAIHWAPGEDRNDSGSPRRRAERLN